MRTLRLPSLALCLLLVGLLATPAEARKGARSGEPVVLEGAELERLVGMDPEKLLAFRLRDREGKRDGKWRQVPVQVDERKSVDFGENPPANPGPGAGGTVYGTAPAGHQALQYADPRTFVGADPDSSLDPDDEVALMSEDAGDRARNRDGHPRGVKQGGATRIKLSDPLGGPKGYLYLYRSQGRLRGDAGKDYVDYTFALASGEYKATYRRGDGPNPESSRIVTDAYEAGFSDRWLYDTLAIRSAGANGVDILDGFKFQFGPDTCVRSEETFSNAEGAFVANIDGPVRAIRSYVGANSGPYTQRTNVFYGSRHVIVTDLRVHAVPGPLIYHDLSPAAIGSSFQSSSSLTPVIVDGVGDSVDPALAEWQLWSGAGGSLFAADRVESSFMDALLANASSFYLDDSTPPHEQCWGDSQALGQFGLRSTTSMPNTDPRLSERPDFLRATTTEILSGPGLGTEQAGRWSAELDAPLVARAKRFSKLSR